jgi:monofunctional biosynthetic peptidoglycan transglycosylase
MGGVCTAMSKNRQAGQVVAGGSTITQQTAKNVFLWQKRSWIRKGLETVYVGWMELLLPKERILELYLGVAEFGPGVYGAEAGSQYWYGRPASSLSQSDAARLVSILPSPKTRTPDGPQASAKAARLLRYPAVFPGERGFEDVGRRWKERNGDLCR